MTQRDGSYTPANASFMLTADQIRAMPALIGDADQALLQVGERLRDDPLRFALCKLIVTGLGEPESWVIEPDGSSRVATPRD